MFCAIALICIVAKTITGRNVQTFITVEMLASMRFGRIERVSLHQKDGSSAATSIAVYLNQFYSVSFFHTYI